MQKLLLRKTPESTRGTLRLSEESDSSQNLHSTTREPQHHPAGEGSSHPTHEPLGRRSQALNRITVVEMSAMMKNIQYFETEQIQ